MTQFNWQSELDEWEVESAVQPRRRPARRLLQVLFFVPFIAALAAFLFWRASLTVDDATARLAGEVTANFALIEQAAATGDVELSRSFLSGRDAAWTNAQIQLLSQGQLVDYDLFGMSPVSSETGPVIFDAELNEAELKVTRLLRSKYAPREEIRLTQTLIFRRGAERWLWAPPQESYWGGRISADYDGLTTSFNERDAELIRRLTDDLAALLPRLCTPEIGFTCDELPELNIIWDTDPASLFAIANSRALYEDRLIRLPTPSLIGYPEDDVSYQSLFNGYASIAIAPVVAELSGWQCCAQRLPFGAILDRQRSLLGIGGDPPDVETYDTLLLEGFLLQQADRVNVNTAVSSDELWAAVVAYILEAEPESTTAALQIALAETQGLDGWFNALFGPRWPISDWQRFVYSQSSQTIAEQPRLPNTNVMAICPANGSDHILGYNPPAAAWRTLANAFSSQSRRGVTPAAGGKIVIEENISFGTEQVWRGEVWREGVRLAGFETVIPPSNLSNISRGRRFLQATPTGGLGTLGFPLLDLENCPNGACELFNVDGPMTWSPDERHSIVTLLTGPEPSLLLADGRGQNGEPLAAGFAARWLDAGTILFFRQDRSAGGTELVMIVATTNGAERAQASRRDLISLADAWPDNFARDDFFLSAIEVNPVDPETLLITLVNRNRRASYLFLFDWVQNTVTPTYNVPETFNVALFSPDGRWLAHYTAGNESVLPRGLWNLSIVDVATGEAQNVGPSTLPEWYGAVWAQESPWLLRTWAGVVYMINASTQYQAALHPPQGSCESAAWLGD